MNDIARKAFSSASPTVRKLNPDAFGLGGLQNPKRQQRQRGPGEDKALEGVPPGVGFCITIIRVCKRMVDHHDNLRTGAKPLVDAITATLGFAADSDKRLEWRYDQLIGDREGTIVRIDVIRTEPSGS